MFSNKHGLTAEKIEELTGRTPREMRFLEIAGNVESFKIERKKRFRMSLDKLYNKFNQCQKADFMLNLSKFFELKYLGSSAIYFDDKTMDAGLLYRSGSPPLYKALSGEAYNCLFEFFLMTAGTSLKPILSHKVGCNNFYDDSSFLPYF